MESDTTECGEVGDDGAMLQQQLKPRHLRLCGINRCPPSEDCQKELRQTENSVLQQAHYCPKQVKKNKKTVFACSFSPRL